MMDSAPNLIRSCRKLLRKSMLMVVQNMRDENKCRCGLSNVVSWAYATSSRIVPNYSSVISMSKCAFQSKRSSTYKYSYKGPHRACMEHSADEVAAFLDTRFCGVPEAAWRLFHLLWHGKSHAVDRLPVHLQLQRSVVFRTRGDHVALSCGLRKRTKLEAWFQLNNEAAVHDVESQQLIASLRCSEIPAIFVGAPPPLRGGAAVKAHEAATSSVDCAMSR